jgi:hypothetical protein
VNKYWKKSVVKYEELEQYIQPLKKINEDIREILKK